MNLIQFVSADSVMAETSCIFWFQSVSVLPSLIYFSYFTLKKLLLIIFILTVLRSTLSLLLD